MKHASTEGRVADGNKGHDMGEGGIITTRHPVCSAMRNMTQQYVTVKSAYKALGSDPKGGKPFEKPPENPPETQF